MHSTFLLRPLDRLAQTVTVFSALLLLAGSVYLAIIGYEMFAPAEEPAVVVSAGQDRAYYEAMSNTPPPIEIGDGNGTSAPGVQPPMAGFIDQVREIASLPASISLVTFLISTAGFAISGLTWVWRAHANIRASGISTGPSPVGAVASYFIPGANLILPFDAMRVLFNRSSGEPEELANVSVDDVTAWWFASIIGLVIFSALTFKFLVDLSTNLVIMTPLWMEFVMVAFALFLLLGSSVLFANLARRISAEQRENLPALAAMAMEQRLPDAVRPSVRVVTRNVDA